MLQASAHQRYEGTVLYERAGSRQFVTVSSPSDHAGQGVLRRMNARADPLPENWPVPFDSPQRACDVATVYLPTLESGRTVAGRATQRLTLRPRDTLRLTHLIDMDSVTGLALAMATVGSEGNMLERYEYASIDYQSASERDPLDKGQREYERGRSVVPGYFVLSEDADRGVFVVSDGLTTASIFVEPLPPGAPVGEGAVIEGATLTYTRGVRSAAGAAGAAALAGAGFAGASAALGASAAAGGGGHSGGDAGGHRDRRMGHDFPVRADARHDR